MPASGAERPCFSEFEHGGGIAGAGIERLDGFADRADRVEQAPEGAEQAEEDQQADEVARGVAAFVEAGGDRIEHGAHRAGREGHRRRAADHRLHRRQQHRFRGFGAGTEGVDPAHFAKQPPDLGEGKQDADHKHADDQAVEAGVGDEGGRDLTGQDGCDEGDDHQEDHHREEEDLWARQFVRVVDQDIRSPAHAEGFEKSHPCPVSDAADHVDRDSKRKL